MKIICPWCKQKPIQFAPNFFHCECQDPGIACFEAYLSDEGFVEYHVWLDINDEASLAFHWLGNDWRIVLIDGSCNEIGKGNNFISPEESTSVLKRYQKLLIFS